MKYGKIECIKLFRNATDYGLVDAKYAVERFLAVFNDGNQNIDNIIMAWKFFEYIGRFSRKVWVVVDGEIYPQNPVGFSDGDLISMVGKPLIR